MRKWEKIQAVLFGAPRGLMKAPALEPRERHVLDLICEGYTSRDIATQMGLSSAVVHSCTGVLRMKLGAELRSQIAKRADDFGMLKGRQKSLVVLEPLPDLQRQVLELTARFVPPEKIAVQLGRARGSVYGALEALRRRYGVRSNLEAVDAAVANGHLTIALPTTVPNPFSEIECRILHALLRKWTFARITADLGVSRKRVNSRVIRMRNHLRVAGNDELLLEAVRLGFITKRGTRPEMVPRTSLLRRRTVTSKRELSSRMIDILKEMAVRKHATHDEIARELGMTIGTFSWHLLRMRQLLGVRGREELLQAAVELDIISEQAGPAARAGDRDVLGYVGEGLSNREIAERLGMTVRQATECVRFLKAKYVAQTRRQLVRNAQEFGLAGPVSRRETGKGFNPTQRMVLELAAKHVSGRSIASRLER